MVLTGGLRDRMIIESLTRNIVADMTATGWFDPGREHSPIAVIDEFPNEDAEVAINTLAFSNTDGTGFPIELGSDAITHRITMFVDFFAENDALARHVCGDIYEFLRTNRMQQVYDYRDDTPQFKVEVLDDLEIRKADNPNTAWRQHWMVVAFTVEDERD